MSTSPQIDELKRQAAGRWPEILVALGGMRAESSTENTMRARGVQTTEKTGSG